MGFGAHGRRRTKQPKQPKQPTGDRANERDAKGTGVNYGTKPQLCISNACLNARSAA